jgi:opacity protein-like surface antigen
MKKFILLTVAFLLFSVAHSQEKKEIYFGIKGGLNLCSITNADQDGVSSSTLVGFHVGVLGEFMLGDNFAIQPELLYSTQGVDVKDSMKTTDFGLNFGVGYNITQNFNMGLRYNLGLTQVQKDLVAGESASKNSVFQIALGYRF